MLNILRTPRASSQRSLRSVLRATWTFSALLQSAGDGQRGVLLHHPPRSGTAADAEADLRAVGAAGLAPHLLQHHGQRFVEQSCCGNTMATHVHHVLERSDDRHLVGAQDNTYRKILKCKDERRGQVSRDSILELKHLPALHRLPDRSAVRFRV